MSIGSRIKEARIKNGLTQEDLASSIGVTKGAIANYENGVSTPKVELLFKLFTALNCDANYLYQDDMKILNDLKATAQTDNNLLKIIEIFSELSPQYQDLAIKQIKLLLEYQKTTKGSN